MPSTAPTRASPAILAHVYGTEPIPTSYTIPFTISSAKGDYGTTLTAPMPDVGNEWGFITGLSLNLGRSFKDHGERHLLSQRRLSCAQGHHGRALQLRPRDLSLRRRKGQLGPFAQLPGSGLT